MLPQNTHLVKHKSLRESLKLSIISRTLSSRGVGITHDDWCPGHLASLERSVLTPRKAQMETKLCGGRSQTDDVAPYSDVLSRCSLCQTLLVAVTKLGTIPTLPLRTTWIKAPAHLTGVVLAAAVLDVTLAHCSS